VRIKEEEEIGYYLPLNNENLKNLSEFEKPERVSENKFKTNTFINSEGSDDSFRLKKPNPTNHFSHLFNSYTKAINKQETRTGSLFQHSFKRKKIDTEDYLKQLIIYIHTNPIKLQIIVSIIFGLLIIPS